MREMVKVLLAGVLALCAFGAQAEIFIAQFTGKYSAIERKVCNKGKPCGNTCINVNYTCHINTPTYPTTPTIPTTPPKPVTPTIPDIASKPASQNSSMGTVARVIDGDTLVVRGPDGEIKVRISQIDAPETSQPFGRQAAACLASLVERQTVLIYMDGHDRYGRTLANVSVNGQDLAQMLVLRGCAWAYTKYLEDGSPLPALQAQAQASGSGLWGLGVATAPWNYRGGSAPVPVTSAGATPVTVTSTTSASTDNRLFDWAEARFSELTQGGTETQANASGTYRCYAGGLCLGIFGGVVNVFTADTSSPLGTDQQFLPLATADGY